MSNKPATQEGSMQWGLSPEGAVFSEDFEGWLWIPVDRLIVIDQCQNRDQYSTWATPSWQGISICGVHHTDQDEKIDRFVKACLHGPILLQPKRLCAVRSVSSEKPPTNVMVLDHISVVKIRKSPFIDRLYSDMDLIGRLLSLHTNIPIPIS